MVAPPVSDPTSFLRAPSSVLFACTWNSIRSPMAEALLKHHRGKQIYVDSVGVRAGEVDQQHVGAGDFQDSVLAADLVVVEDDVVAVEPANVEDRVGGYFVDNIPIHNQVDLR